MKHRVDWFLPIAFRLLLLSANPASAQIALSAGTYSQDFDSLASSATASWTDNITLPGWYASRSVAPNSVTAYSTGTGSSMTGGLYSFGESSSTDRALGSLASGGTGKLAYGVRFTNDTGLAQSGFTVSYTGEQWRVADTGMQKLAFSYQIGTALSNADARGDQNWTPFPALDFCSPNTNATQALNGNDPTNQVVFARILLPGGVVPPGQELFLRWLDANDAGYDDGLAIDNLTLSFTLADTNAVLFATNGGFSLLTYNTHGNQIENWSTNSYQVRAIGRQLVYLKPDIITFNEIPDTNTWQMENWVKAFLPGYFLATNSESDGSIRNVIASRFPVVRSQSWLHDADLAPYGYTNSGFKRDLFEAEISVPEFPQSLHVFSVHLKSGQDADASAQRAAQAAAISNFLVTAYLTANGLQPYVLTGDMNEDLVRPPSSNPESIQRLISGPTGLQLTTPLNPFTQSELTFSIQTDSLSKRYDYILPCALLFSNIAGSMVFHTDPLTNEYPMLRTNDSRTASDHLPVLMVFNNPYNKPFRLLSITRSNQSLALTWESVPGQSYGVESSFDITSWTSLADNVLATGSDLAFSTNVPAVSEFFRVRRTP
jgi:hypothetical protein